MSTSTSTSTEIPVATTFDLSNTVVGLARETGQASFLHSDGRGPARIDGYTIGAPRMTQNPPHNGELHPDSDELLYLISGRVKVLLELPAGDTTVDVGPGEALVVPRGVWHLVLLQEPSHLLHITPGPGSDHRPLDENA